MSKNINQIFIANPITSNASTDLMYFGQSPYGAGNDAAMTYANFATQFGAPYTAAALTSSNDTNVTITIGGTPATSLLRAVSLTMGWTGQLALTRGGSNASLTASNGGIVYSTASAMAILAGTATANLPLLSGSSAAPTWGAFSLSLGGALTTAGALTTIGAFGATFTFTGTTNVTFPTSGTLATTGGSVPSIQGTANEVLVNGTSGSPVTGSAITLTTPQAIGTSSTPQFSGAIFGSPTGSVANASGTIQAVGLSGGLGSYYAESYFNGSGSAPTYWCYKSRSATVGSFTAVQSGDTLGRFLVFGDDGTQFSQAGALVLNATGTISNGIVPGNWNFQTANASGVLTTGMTIDSGQNVAFTHPLTPPSGGTGVSNPTAHTLPVAEGSSNFTFLGPLTNGQLLIGSTGADPVTAAITAGTNISITNGAGSITVNTSGLASFAWTDVTGTSQAMVANNGYIADNAGLVTLTLPSTAAQGTLISVCGNGAGGWSIAQNASQNIKFGSQTTTTGTGGSLSSSNRYDQVDILCTVANTTWVVRHAVGNLTFV